jgi:cold shock CspA family protein
MKGSITRILQNQQCGFILSQEGNEVYFKEDDVEGGDIRDLHIGQWVEFEMQYGFERPRAVSIKRVKVHEQQRGAAAR